MTIAESAAALGVSVDTVRRRIKQGRLEAHTDPSGRVMVMTPSVPRPATAPGAAPDPLPFTSPMISFSRSDITASDLEREQLARELEHARAMLAEVQRQRDELSVLLAAQRAQVETLTRLVEQDAAERAELRRLLGDAMQSAGGRGSA
jgi:excisionase family DNA binding protein